MVLLKLLCLQYFLFQKTYLIFSGFLKMSSIILTGSIMMMKHTAALRSMRLTKQNYNQFLVYIDSLQLL